MDRRREERVAAEVCVRISGLDPTGAHFTQTVRVRSLSVSGGLITGVQHELRCGDSIVVRPEQQSARFKVVWTRDDRAAIQKRKDQPCPWQDLLQEQASETRL